MLFKQGYTIPLSFRVFGSPKVTALVIRTGFTTIKGSLVRGILYPRPNKFKFYTDSYKFIAVLALISFIGFLASIPAFLEENMQAWEIAIRSLDLITITVPPALPIAMSIGTSFAIKRLRKRRIYCISPPRVNVGGKVTTMVFDKTGTLTEEGLYVYGFRLAKGYNNQMATFDDFKSSLDDFIPNDLCSNEQVYQKVKDSEHTLFIEGLASCHSATYVDGELIGDPLDVKMFEATGWVLEEPSAGTHVDEPVIYLSNK